MQAHLDPILNPPGILIAQQLDGVNAGQSIETEVKDLDNRQSCIYGKSRVARFNNGNPMTVDKNTADKIVIGYVCDGLPFQIVVHGLADADREHVFNFIDLHVTPMMNVYADKLSDSKNTDKTIKSLIRKIQKLRSNYEHADHCEFSMSVGITYEKENNLFCAGFGIGGTGLVLSKANGELQQLANTTYVNGSPDNDAFKNDIDMERVINRNSRFNIPVNPNDKIFGYTYLPPDLLSVTETFNDKHELAISDDINDNIMVDDSSPVEHRILNIEEFNGSDNLLRDVNNANNLAFDNFCQDTINRNKSRLIDNGCLISIVPVPAPEIHNQLKHTVYIQELQQFNDQIARIEGTDAHAKALCVREHITDLARTDANISLAAKHLAACNRAMMNPTVETVKALKSQALKLEGKPSAGLKALGIAMMILGTALAIAGGLIIAGSFGLVATGVFTIPGAAGCYAGGGIIAGGVTLFSAGAAFLATGCQKGPSKDMYNLATQCEASIPVNVRNN